MLVPTRLMATTRFVPLPIAARIADLLFQQVLAAHPRLFDRLGDYVGTRFAFVPDDLPFSFLICPVDRRVITLRRSRKAEADATIAGPLVLMLALVEGRVDGDALFFARRLLVTGDMEAVLALRNALDDNEIDLVKTMGKWSGPIKGPITAMLETVRREALKSQGVQWN